MKLTLVMVRESDEILDPEVSGKEFVELLVSDTGNGMDKNTMERIFEPYFTTIPFGENAGMGLSLVHGIVQSQGVFIKVESEPGQGSTFHIYFPPCKIRPSIHVKRIRIRSQEGMNEY